MRGGTEPSRAGRPSLSPFPTLTYATSGTARRSTERAGELGGDYLVLRRRGSGMRSTTDVALFLRALLSGMNRPVLAERPRSVNRGFLVAMEDSVPGRWPG